MRGSFLFLLLYQYNINCFYCLYVLFSFWKKIRRSFLVQNKKRTKRNLQAFRLTKAQTLPLSAIGSPHGFSMNEFIEPSAGVGYGTSRRNNRRWAETSDFICDGALAPFGKRFFHWARARPQTISFAHMNYATLDESNNTTAFFEPDDRR